LEKGGKTHEKSFTKLKSKGIKKLWPRLFKVGKGKERVTLDHEKEKEGIVGGKKKGGLSEEQCLGEVV